MTVQIPAGQELEDVYQGDIRTGFDYINGHKILLVNQAQDVEYSMDHVFAALEFCIEFVQDDSFPDPKIIIVDMPAHLPKNLLMYMSEYRKAFNAFAQHGAYMFLVSSNRVAPLSRFLAGVVQRSVNMSMVITDSLEVAQQSAEALINEWRHSKQKIKN